MSNLHTDLLASQYRKIRTCLAGEDEVKNAAQLHLPRPDGMTTANYQAYALRASFFGAPEMTLRALAGLLLRKAPVVKLPKRLEPMRLRATNDKAPLSILIEDCARELLAQGRFGILLDFPRADNTALTTPHFATFVAETIEDWETQYVDGQVELTKVVLSSDEAWDGADVYLELALEEGIYKIRRFIREGQNKVRADVDEVVPLVAGRPLNFIPFLMMSHESLRPQNAKPPLLDLCNVALSHYRNSADREHALFLTSCPTPWIAGNIAQDKLPTAIGSGAVWYLPEGSTCGYLEFSGAGVAAMKALMDEKLEQMAALGARMLSAVQNRNESIDTATQRTRSELSLLHSVCVTMEAGLNRMLKIAATWLNENPDEASITFNRDFIESTLPADQLVAQMKLWQAGAISRQTFYENLQKGEIARADRSYEEEVDLIETDNGDLSTLLPTLT